MANNTYSNFPRKLNFDKRGYTKARQSIETFLRLVDVTYACFTFVLICIHISTMQISNQSINVQSITIHNKYNTVNN